MTENDIQEDLYKNLNIYFPNLKAKEKELYLPYDGKRSFIDILAIDEKNNHVIIEIKKSNQSSREALHEILKYTEFLKKNYLINDDHIRSIIISTEWKELIIPFSKFIQSNKSLNIEGILLNVNNEGKYLNHEIINPLKITDELFFSPAHMYFFYESKKSLEKGYNSLITEMKKYSINDYILLKLEKPINSNIYYEFNYIIYFSMLRKTKEEYEKIVNLFDQEDKLELTYLIESDYHRKGLSAYEKAIILAIPIHSDSMRGIAKPLTLESLLLMEEWRINEVIKIGKLNNNLLSDEQLIDEVLGYSGSGDVIYREKFKLSEKNKIEKIKNKSSDIFKRNQMWKNQFLTIINNIITEIPSSSEIEINIYNPENILLSLYQNIKYCQDSSKTAIPHFSIDINSSNKCYVGILTWKKNKTYKFNKIYKEIYKDDSDLFIKTQTSFIENNEVILDYLDLEYNSIELNLENKNKKYFYNGIFREEPNTKIILDFIEKEKEFINDLFKKFNSNSFTI